MKPIFFRRRPNSAKTGQGRVFILFWLLCCLLLIYNRPFAYSQSFQKVAPFKYRICFTDKNGSPYSSGEPEKFLSHKAIDRRERNHVEVTLEDIPVSPDYINRLAATGAKILHVSRWFNSAIIEATDTSILDSIAKLPFVICNHNPVSAPVQIIPSSHNQGSQGETIENIFDYGTSWLQIAVHNGQFLHEKGLTGKNITIAVIDAGFSNVDILPAFNRLWENGKILGSHDFVNPGNNVFYEATHGMSVLSIIGGFLPNELVGTAPDASFWLLRSEDGYTENIIEEDNWIAAAEFADSAGADILSTSLGYSEFNDSLQNHSYSDMDGNTTRITIGADKAASKGMLVINSAGNQGNSRWRFITAPADGDSVLTVGAVDPSLSVAGFSSRGPSSDNRIKPDVVALGQGVYVSTVIGTISRGNGTSYSAPIITGLAASLWQAHPEATSMQIFNAIKESANRYYSPDNEYGFGIPDFHLAHILLHAHSNKYASEPALVFPNPFYTQLYLYFAEPVNESVEIKLYDITGKEVFNNLYPAVDGRKYIAINSDLRSLSKGAYLIRYSTRSFSGISKLIKY